MGLWGKLTTPIGEFMTLQTWSIVKVYTRDLAIREFAKGGMKRFE